MTKGLSFFFRKKKSNEPKYYKTLGWCWGYLFLYPLGYSMRAVTEYDPNDTYELFCHDVYGVHPHFIHGWPSPIYFSPAMSAIIALWGIVEHSIFPAYFIPGWALFVTFANWYFTIYERDREY